MKYNYDYDKNEIIKINKNKFMFLGFILGITPFIIILGIISFHEGGIKYVPAIFKNTITIFALITSLLNALILRFKIANKLSD